MSYRIYILILGKKWPKVPKGIGSGGAKLVRLLCEYTHATIALEIPL
jgi:hypothetical protein